MVSQLDYIKEHTKIVADTGDFKLISKYKPVDSTTNPSLIKQACGMPQYKPLVDKAIEIEREKDPTNVNIEKIIDRITVSFGVEILKLIPGKVSSEIDASLSFDIDGMVLKGLELINLYQEYGISSDRIYLKLPSTWEGIQAAKILKYQHTGIQVNMTLIFSLVQAVACADVGADLISPFVGRISDWFKNVKGMKIDSAESDPGVLSVRAIANYFKKFDISTIIMGASFRNIDQIKALCGIDALTISPKLLEELNSQEGEVDEFSWNTDNIEKIFVDEKTFRWLMNCDEMACSKLSEGIRLFHNDTVELREVIKKLIDI